MGDYAIPINFSGRKWIEVPNCEQGWRLRNWSWSAKTKKFCDFRKISEISIGLGYIPANTKANVSIEHLQALEEILEPIENATITVGDHGVALDSVINPYNHFTVHSEGNFTVYDENWNMLSVEFVGEFLPSDISDFLMESKTSSRKIWLEATVQVSNETKNSTPMEPTSSPTGGGPTGIPTVFPTSGVITADPTSSPKKGPCSTAHRKKCKKCHKGVKKECRKNCEFNFE